MGFYGIASGIGRIHVLFYHDGFEIVSPVRAKIHVVSNVVKIALSVTHHVVHTILGSTTRMHNVFSLAGFGRDSSIVGSAGLRSQATLSKIPRKLDAIKEGGRSAGIVPATNIDRQSIGRWDETRHRWNIGGPYWQPSVLVELHQTGVAATDRPALDTIADRGSRHCLFGLPRNVSGVSGLIEKVAIFLGDDLLQKDFILRSKGSVFCQTTTVGCSSIE